MAMRGPDQSDDNKSNPAPTQERTAKNAQHQKAQKPDPLEFADGEWPTWTGKIISGKDTPDATPASVIRKIGSDRIDGTYSLTSRTSQSEDDSPNTKRIPGNMSPPSIWDVEPQQAPKTERIPGRFDPNTGYNSPPDSVEVPDEFEPIVERRSGFHKFDLPEPEVPPTPEPTPEPTPDSTSKFVRAELVSKGYLYVTQYQKQPTKESPSIGLDDFLTARDSAINLGFPIQVIEGQTKAELYIKPTLSYAFKIGLARTIK